LLSPKLILDHYREFARSCPEYRDGINLTYLPLQHYRVYERWKPKRVKVLFLAESPPWRKKSTYFYNQQRSGGLSEAIFNYLKIKGDSKTVKLQEFKRRQFFLTDTVKCVFEKSQTGSIPQRLIRYSAREILQEELSALRPRSILALGATALAGLKQIGRFSTALSRYPSITLASGKSVRVGKTTLILSVFPNDRNRRHEKSISSAFHMIG
jgi:uracil DNA glycosylase superfamily protein